MVFSADKFVKGKRVMTGGKHQKELEKGLQEQER